MASIQVGSESQTKDHHLALTLPRSQKLLCHVQEALKAEAEPLSRQGAGNFPLLLGGSKVDPSSKLEV